MRNLSNWIFGFIPTLGIIMGFIGCLSSCNVDKNVQKVVVDSTALKIKEDSIHFLKKIVDKLEAEIREMEYSEIIFDTVYVLGDTVVNTVIVREDGTIEATGKIKSLTITKDKLTRIINEKNLIIDSLSKVKQKERIEYKTTTKTVEKKVRFIPWWFWLIAATVLGFYLYEKFKP